MMGSNLLKAILAMDSYNQGYDAGIIVNQTQIGTASIVIDSKNLGVVSGTQNFLDQKAGFYAVAYKLDTGETVISYRGTDLLFGSISRGIGSDIYNGYGVARGSVDGAQADLAFKFYNAVATSLNNGTAVDPRSANISLTGHSLGGGVAGLVGAVYGKSGLLFDNMTFEQAARNAQVTTNTALKADIYGNYNGGVAWAPTITSSSASALKTDYMEGEFLGMLRGQSDQLTPVLPMHIGTGVNLPGLDNGLLGGHLHSMSTLTMILYSDTSGVTPTWDYAAKYFWPVAYDDTFALSYGGTFSTAQGASYDAKDYSGIVRTALAYSALDTNTVFGNTGIVSFFHDANVQGAMLQRSNLSQSLTDVINTDISKVFVQYAGELALNKVLQAQDAAAVNGVLALAADGGALTVSFDTALWTQAGGGTLPPMAAQAALVNDLLAAFDPQGSANGQMSGALGGYGGATAIDRVVLATADGGSVMTLADNPHATAAKAALFIGGYGADTVTGSSGNDLILTGAGDDRVYVSKGNDTVYEETYPRLVAGTHNVLDFSRVNEDVTLSFFGSYTGYDTADRIVAIN